MTRLAFAITLLAVAGLARASFWQESIQGDLSGVANAPTPLTFDLGPNRVIGTMGTDTDVGTPTDRDIFTVTIPLGQAITSIYVNIYDPPGASFYAIAPGTSISLTDPSAHLSNVLINRTGEFLPNLAAGAYSGGLGLSDPMPAGTYTIWFQELASVVTYDFTYTVSVIPEPSAFALMLPPIALLRRRR